MGEEALGLGADGLFPRRERRSRVRIWHRRIPGGCFGLQGHGRICVDLQDDGDFLFAPSALWTAGHYRLPLLIIINNNGCYYNAERQQLRVAEARNRDTGKIGVGTSLEDPRVDYAMLAKSFGIYAEGPITDPDKIRQSISRAVEVVQEEGRPAVVDVVTASYAK